MAEVAGGARRSLALVPTASRLRGGIKKCYSWLSVSLKQWKASVVLAEIEGAGGSRWHCSEKLPAGAGDLRSLERRWSMFLVTVQKSVAEETKCRAIRPRGG